MQHASSKFQLVTPESRTKSEVTVQNQCYQSAARTLSLGKALTQSVIEGHRNRTHYFAKKVNGPVLKRCEPIDPCLHHRPVVNDLVLVRRAGMP